MKKNDDEILLPGDVMLIWANGVKSKKCPSIVVCNSSNAWICVTSEVVYTSLNDKRYAMFRKNVAIAFTID